MNDLIKPELPSYNHTLTVDEISSRTVSLDHNMLPLPKGFMAGFPVGESPKGWSLQEDISGFIHLDIQHLIWMKD